MYLDQDQHSVKGILLFDHKLRVDRTENSNKLAITNSSRTLVPYIRSRILGYIVLCMLITSVVLDWLSSAGLVGKLVYGAMQLWILARNMHLILLHQTSSAHLRHWGKPLLHIGTYHFLLLSVDNYAFIYCHVDWVMKITSLFGRGSEMIFTQSITYYCCFSLKSSVPKVWLLVGRLWVNPDKTGIHNFPDVGSAIAWQNAKTVLSFFHLFPLYFFHPSMPVVFNLFHTATHLSTQYNQRTLAHCCNLRHKRFHWNGHSHTWYSCKVTDIIVLK